METEPTGEAAVDVDVDTEPLVENAATAAVMESREAPETRPSMKEGQVLQSSVTTAASSVWTLSFSAKNAR